MATGSGSHIPQTEPCQEGPMSAFRRKRRGDDRPELDRVLDLSAPLPEPDSYTPTGGRPGVVWGMPSACPRCGDYGYLDHIDLINEVMLQHCPTCWHRWTVAKTETVGT